MPSQTTADTRARFAVAGVFLTNGALFANVVPRFPEIKASLGLGNAALGTALAAFPLGALVAGLFAPALINRFRSSRVAALGIVVLAVALAAVALAGNWLTFAAVMLVAGALDSVIDVAQNTHGLRVQRRYGRSIVNSFHGVWSIGAVAGGLMGSAAAGLSVPLGWHMLASSALFSVVALVCYRFMLPGDDDTERVQEEAPVTVARRFRGPTVRLLVAFGVLAACGALVEDAGSSWGAVYLSGSLGAGAATAGLAFVSLQVAMTAGRLLGDRVIDRYGQRPVVRAGGALTAVGLGFALAVPAVWTTLVGFALAGLGVATLIPAAMHSADELPGLPSGVGLTVVSWMLRIGSLASPPLVGVVADAVSLRVGLLSVVVAGLVVLVLGRVMANNTHHSPAPDPG
ncbi:MFS transporter [Actinokineospora sp. NBRC 105648]|uniref:MFS transporter n=1 Tax=Actinokineospora sp. NBRC 105648 TaxID=3032206 RepID=UPI0024A0502E|nr:MFS transporter [Actinokineospora sp. NBRC 105648]GLZ38864.1 MFS transporter [Actinokineospora sp. NBRC 105648]